jgi:hypothetical protein
MVRNLPTFMDCAQRASTWAIVGGGPSAANDVQAIRALKCRGANIVSVNKSHDWLLSHGIVPWGHVLLDPKEWVADYVGKPRRDVRYFLASQCHDRTFEALRDYPVFLWHAGQDFEEGPEPNSYLREKWPRRPWFIVPGGTTVGLRAVQLGQSVGSNVNLWGGYINTDLAMLEQAAKGFQSLAVTGDASISWTNYAAGNTGACARLKLTGSLAAAAVLTFPAYHNYISVENTTAQTITIKCSGGAGVAIAAGAKVLIYCDGVDYYNAAPTVLGSGNVTLSGKISGVTAGAAATDAVNKTQMEAAIATAGLPATAATLLVSSSDTTAGYLGQKLVAGTDVTLADSGGGNSTLTVATVPYWNAPRNLAFADSPITALDRDILLLDTSGGSIEVDLPASGRVKIVDVSGDASTNNITVDPAGADTATFDVIDTDYFEGIWQRNGTNWDLT